MDVILLERVQKLGAIGDTVRVKDGYARNFLLPNGKALRATSANKKLFEAQRVEIEKRNAELKAQASTVASKIDGKTYVIVRQAGETGQLYGSVSSRDIAEQVSQKDVTILRSQVMMNAPIKALGVYKFAIHLHGEVDANITVNVARSEEEAVRQLQGENLSLKVVDKIDFTPADFSAEFDADARSA